MKAGGLEDPNLYPISLTNSLEFEMETPQKRKERGLGKKSSVKRKGSLLLQLF
jgi:hypothetical protein